MQEFLREKNHFHSHWNTWDLVYLYTTSINLNIRFSIILHQRYISEYQVEEDFLELERLQDAAVQ